MICEELASCCLTVRTRLISPILLYALTTEELATGLMLSWVSSYRQADQALEGVSWFRHKLAVIATEIGSHFFTAGYGVWLYEYYYANHIPTKQGFIHKREILSLSQ